MDELSISDAAKRAGVQPSALRYYESIGLLPLTRRVNGRRRFDANSMQRLTVIRLAKEAGFTIAEIQTLLYGFESDMPPSARWRILAQRKLLEVDALIERASAMKRLLKAGLACGCLNYEDCMLIEEIERDDAARANPSPVPVRGMPVAATGVESELGKPAVGTGKAGVVAAVVVPVDVTMESLEKCQSSFGK